MLLFLPTIFFLPKEGILIAWCSIAFGVVLITKLLPDALSKAGYDFKWMRWIRGMEKKELH